MRFSEQTLERDCDQQVTPPRLFSREAFAPSEDDAPKAKSKGRQDYRIKHALKPPRSTTYTAQSLYDQIVDGSINLGPEYQRDVVWSTEKQIGLIDSIFRNFYIPPLIFAVSTHEDGTEARTCIDGKQRLTSIQKFMDGLIYHRDPDNARDKYYFTNPVKNAAQLPGKYKNLFGTKQIVCIEYFDLDENDEREIFRRVQLGMALNDAEKMKALARNRKTDLVQDLTNLYTERLADLGFRTARDTVFRWIATACYTIRRGTEITNSTTPTQLNKWLAEEGGKHAMTEVMAEGIRESMEKFMDVIEMPGAMEVKSGPAQKSLAPVDFVMCIYLVYTLREEFSTEALYRAIKQGRQRARDGADNVMYNSNTCRRYYDFVEKLQDYGEEALESDDEMDVDDAPQPKKRKVAKRKRREPSSSTSPEPEPAPRTSRVTSARAKKAAATSKSPAIKTRASPPIQGNGFSGLASASTGGRASNR
ncbi:unnamed protein product [Peniophora sp. CBMAI 1063]|nr:unnamed protein product [Peniophora sp. CBMAI 1063]